MPALATLQAELDCFIQSILLNTENMERTWGTPRSVTHVAIMICV